ncbi:hypothetical protein HanPI659440_Chr07g0261851 [Helianthus annuus]|nr:hypothetical protein HanPI659440_Chr07g0261851 [Helianthus annuus]
MDAFNLLKFLATNQLMGQNFTVEERYFTLKYYHCFIIKQQVVHVPCVADPEIVKNVVIGRLHIALPKSTIELPNTRIPFPYSRFVIGSSQQTYLKVGQAAFCLSKQN